MAITFSALKLWSDGREALIQPRNPADVMGRYYLRFNVDDRPGVMADIAGILGKHKISIASLIQHENDEEEESRAVPLVIMTHSAAEGAMRGALQAIEVLSSVHPGTVRMRIRN
jgi:homoserine dehydrogenase